MQVYSNFFFSNEFILQMLILNSWQKLEYNKEIKLIYINDIFNKYAEYRIIYINNVNKRTVLLSVKFHSLLLFLIWF